MQSPGDTEKYDGIVGSMYTEKKRIKFLPKKKQNFEMNLTNVRIFYFI